MTTDQGRDLRRSHLFLVRLWVSNSSEPGARSQAGDETGAHDHDQEEWHGRVHRVIDGEAHLFNNLQDLTDLLLVMLSHNERR